jgi:hypothetical protein
MSKGQKRNSREQKKPKQDKPKVPVGSLIPSFRAGKFRDEHAGL